jgi:hypothetical protein
MNHTVEAVHNPYHLESIFEDCFLGYRADCGIRAGTISAAA